MSGVNSAPGVTLEEIFNAQRSKSLTLKTLKTIKTINDNSDKRHGSRNTYDAGSRAFFRDRAVASVELTPFGVGRLAYNDDLPDLFCLLKHRKPLDEQ